MERITVGRYDRSVAIRGSAIEVFEEIQKVAYLDNGPVTLFGDDWILSIPARLIEPIVLFDYLKTWSYTFSEELGKWIPNEEIM